MAKKTDPLPPAPGDDAPATEVRAVVPPSFAPDFVPPAPVAPSRGEATEIARLSSAVTRNHTNIAALRLALEAWMRVHGAACACELCVHSRGVLAETHL